MKNGETIVEKKVVIRSYLPKEGHFFTNFSGIQPEMTTDQALRIIKARINGGRSDGVLELYFIGENGIVEVDPDKIKCLSCRYDLELSLKKEGRGRRL